MVMTRQPTELRQGHEYVLDRLSPYIDDQLKSRERARVEAHLNTCASCRDELQTLEWTRSLLRQAPVVPIPRSFVIREADLAPRQDAQRRAARRRPAFALQWAAALVAVLLVVVVAGDLFLSGRLASPGGAPEVAMLGQQKADAEVTVVVESETALEAPAAQAPVEEGAELATPAESLERVIAPTSTDAAAPMNGQGTEQPKAMRVEAPVTGTTSELPMAVKEESSAAPESPSQGNVIPEGTSPGLPPPPPLAQQVPETTVPPAAEQGQPQEQGTPLAMAPKATTQADEPLPEPERAESPERDTSSTLPELLSRAGWRVAEVGLGLLLVGLIGAILWRRRQR
jgi:anti-sigma factor RsiW